MTTKYDLQRAYEQQLGMANSIGDYARMSQTRVNPLQGYDIRSIPLDELEQMIEFLSAEFERRTLDTPLQGPTRRELKNDSTLNEAWEAYMVLRKLKGK